jgi:cyclophilin family peptidyl-prolyl cis-trans isomerase
MLKPFPLLALGAVLLTFAGCRSRPVPELYEPGDIPTWRTVETAGARTTAEERPLVVLNTSQGSITIELFEALSPETTSNFLEYVESGFYDGTVFHRVIPGFMIQGGGFSPEMEEKPTRAPITNESNNGLDNRRGTVAMARTSDPDSATAQFFINLVDNAFLDATVGSEGYAVFARVVEGMGVVDEIANVATARRGTHDDVPLTPVLITSARRIR